MSFLSSQPWVDVILMSKLKNIEPNLDIRGSDKRVLEICCSDFRNYIEYLGKMSVLSCSIPESVDIEIDLANGSYTISKENEVMDFIDVWVKMWWKKWKSRVKLVVAQQSLTIYEKSEALSKKGNVILRKLSNEEIEEIKEAAKHVLFKNGEICCTELISTALLKLTLGKQPTIVIKWDNEQKLNLMVSIMREARNMSRTNGPLVFIRPDKRYYKIREYRNDEGKPQVL